VKTHRIHGAGIYANIGGILMGSMLPHIAAPWIRHGKYSHDSTSRTPAACRATPQAPAGHMAPMAPMAGAAGVDGASLMVDLG